MKKAGILPPPPKPPKPPPARIYNAFGVLLNEKEIEIWRKNNDKNT